MFTTLVTYSANANAMKLIPTQMGRSDFGSTSLCGNDSALAGRYVR